LGSQQVFRRAVRGWKRREESRDIDGQEAKRSRDPDPHQPQPDVHILVTFSLIQRKN